MSRVCMSLAGFFVVVGLLWSQAGEPFKPGKLPKTEQEALAPGLTLRFVEPSDSTKTLDAKRIRVAALHVPEGTRPTPFLPVGPFAAQITGYLKAPIRSDYQFHVVAKGAAVLTINGKEVVKANDGAVETEEPVELARGYNKIEIAFRSPAKGDATLRVSWTGEGFNREPLPPDLLFSRNDDADLVVHTKEREGRMHFAMQGCQHCHSLPDGVTLGMEAMPELQHQAPSLQAAGSRFGTDWMAQWILNPRELRPKATMPAVLHGATAPQQAADLAAYLASLTDAAQPRRPAKGDKAQGEKLFRTLGCLACHHFNDPKEEETLDRYPLFYVTKKYQPDALISFLQAPHAQYPWSRMPDFKLSLAEAENLAAYLQDEAKGTVAEKAKGDPERGKMLFGSSGCASCHALKAGFVLEGMRRLPFPEKAAVEKGCLANDAAARKNAPDYGFKKNKLDALREFVKGQGKSLAHDTPAEFAQRQVVNLKCTACHRRDGNTSRWFQVLEEEGTLPENLPLLTWTGEKLRPEWTKKLLAGGHDHRARPWLKARMPSFPARAETLGIGLSHEHGFAVNEDNRPAPNAELAEVGKKLLPQMGGLNCVQCHGIGKTPPVAPFEAPGINLLDAAHRVRYDYYQRWMLDPPRVDITTKMVKLAMDGKTTGIREIFDGDARQQFEALWHFIQTLPASEKK